MRLRYIFLIFAIIFFFICSGLIVLLKVSRSHRLPITPVDDVKELYNFKKELSKCEDLCNKWAQNKTTLNALAFCQKKVSIDIDGDGRIGQENSYNVLIAVPFCEDGIYCFHIKECGSRADVLDAKGCLINMQKHYEIDNKLPKDVTAKLINERVHYGTCEPNITKWEIAGYIPVKLNNYYNSDWNTGIKYMGPDYWWAITGYNEFISKS